MYPGALLQLPLEAMHLPLRDRTETDRSEDHKLRAVVEMEKRNKMRAYVCIYIYLFIYALHLRSFATRDCSQMSLKQKIQLQHPGSKEGASCGLGSGHMAWHNLCLVPTQHMEEEGETRVGHCKVNLVPNGHAYLHTDVHWRGCAGKWGMPPNGQF